MNEYPYWQKNQEATSFQDFFWNLPEQKTGTLTIIGGNSQNFASTIKISEYTGAQFPFKTICTVLPDALKNQLPTLPYLFFTPSTESGSFKKSPELTQLATDSNALLLLGDYSKNSATNIAIAEILKNTTAPLAITRDGIDLSLSEANTFLERPELFIIATLTQLQKLFRAVYYPKVLLLSMPLTAVIEALHKFTLSYPSTILTFHANQIIIASHGKINTIPLSHTHYTPLSLWQGQLASAVISLNFYNKDQALSATTAAVFHQPKS